MAKKYYAVKKGYQPGVYETWTECKEQVHGFSGASYKSFLTFKEAAEFVSTTNAIQSVGAARNAIGSGSTPPVKPSSLAEAIAYVDGSYDDTVKEFAYGVVMFANGTEEHFSAKMNDAELVGMRNVAGEIKAAERAMQFCVDHHIRSVDIYHDYEGIAKWCTGEWKANKTGTQAYKAFYDRIKANLLVNFIKVEAHSGDTYNDLADFLAKSALGIR